MSSTLCVSSLYEKLTLPVCFSDIHIFLFEALNVKDCKRREACLHSGYNYVGLSRVYALWGFNPVPLFVL